MTTLLVITGASRGLGRSFGLAFLRHPQTNPIKAVLIARSPTDLEQTQTLMTELARKNSLSLTVSKHVVDLSDLEILEPTIEALFSSLEKEDDTYRNAIFINNAGSVGRVGPISQSDGISLSQFRKEMDLNVTSSSWITARFACYFSTAAAERCTVVNVSSLCAVQPFKTMGGYCAGKAARDMFHATLAVENPRVRVLNYAPGACDTAMTEGLMGSADIDEDLKNYFCKTKEDGTFVKQEDTADRLMGIVLDEEMGFESGSHVDYWDLVGDAR